MARPASENTPGPQCNVYSAMQQTYFRKGFGLKAEVKPLIDSEYHSAIVERIRSRAYTDRFGDVTVRLAKDFGFCYGVDRAIDYAYETRHKFPDRRIYLVGEIIHNPHVNRRLEEMGIELLFPGDDGEFHFDRVTPDDVVIIPAFGVTITDLKRLKAIGCVLVDTTCGSVLLVWKRVNSYARDGFTAVIHGKYKHEESRATASQVKLHDGGRYIIVRDMAEAERVGTYMTGGAGAMSRNEFLHHFADRSSDGFDPDRDLKSVGVANQTTMLATESLAIGARLREMMAEAFGEDHAQAHFRSFDTICSATQERQDAVLEMMDSPPDIMVVVGGYNSSNTNHLAHLCRNYTTTYHIKDASCIDVDTGLIHHKAELDPGAPEISASGWLPSGPVEIGITAGASTPNNKIGEAVARMLRIRGIEPDV